MVRPQERPEAPTTNTSGPSPTQEREDDMTGLNAQTGNGKSGISAGFSPEDYEKAKAARALRSELAESGELYTLKDGNGEAVKMLEVRAGTDGRGREISFGYSKSRNEYGFYVGCRLVRSPDGTVTQDKHLARRQRKGVRAIAQSRADRFKERSSGDRPASNKMAA